MIIIVDYGLGNLGSIMNMCKRIGIEAKISSDKNDILNAQKLILPGVGAFDNGMNCLKEKDFINLLNEKVIIQKTPILGICLGMQLMTLSSEEGNERGLGWIDAKTIRFDFSNRNSDELKIPHMGWNEIKIVNDNILLKNLEEPRYYFVHSYYVVCSNKNNISTTTTYGIEFVSAFQKENIFGVQFHPEKSHKFGMKLIENFATLC